MVTIVAAPWRYAAGTPSQGVHPAAMMSAWKASVVPFEASLLLTPDRRVELDDLLVAVRVEHAAIGPQRGRELHPSYRSPSFSFGVRVADVALGDLQLLTGRVG